LSQGKRGEGKIRKTKTVYWTRGNGILDKKTHKDFKKSPQADYIEIIRQGEKTICGISTRRAEGSVAMSDRGRGSAKKLIEVRGRLKRKRL